MRKNWEREQNGSDDDGEVYRNAALSMTVMRLTPDRCRRWFISRGLSYVENKRGDVRLFWTAEGAMRAAEKL